MIGRIEGSMVIASLVPSAGRSIGRRQKRLKWLSSLREALDEAGPLVDQIDAEAPIVVQTRARIADALSTVEELSGQLRAGADEAVETVSGGTTTAAALAARIAAAADRSLRAQAHISPASVRRLVDGTR